MKELLKELFDYNLEANRAIISMLKGNDNSRAKELICHVINAHGIWISRINRTEAPKKHLDTYSMDEAEMLNSRNYFDSLEITENDDIDKVIEYTNLQGEEAENSIREIFIHVINHSSYHRGQASSQIRSGGEKPPPTDYIAYARKKRKETK